MIRAIFFDRDGVLNDIVMRGGVVGSPRVAGEFSILPEAIPMVSTAKARGFLAIVVTNQPDIGRAIMHPRELDAMHAALRRAIQVDDILVATGGDDSDPLRKPNPGMIFEAARKWKIHLGSSWIVGDSSKDIRAGESAGISTILLETHYNSDIHGTASQNFTSHNQITSYINTL